MSESQKPEALDGQAALTFEEKMKALERVSAQLSKGDMPLDALLESFEQGIGLYKECMALLTETEAKIEMIVRDGSDDV